MSSVSYFDIKPLVYTYLGYRKILESEDVNHLIEESLKELDAMESFRYMYQEFDYILDVLNKKPYLDYLKGSEGYYVAAMTLGVMVDKKIRYYEKTDMLKMCVFDATASAYLEYKSDEFERILRPDLGYRFCPGYGGTDVSDIRPLYQILHAEKIGITLLDSDLMIPSKSMIGIIGIKNNKRKTCKDCILQDACRFKKEGMTCYQEK